MLSRVFVTAVTVALLIGAPVRAWAAPWAGRLQAQGIVGGVATAALDMTFGVADGATDGFDRGVDALAPPDAPLPFGSKPPAPYFLNTLEPRSWLQRLIADTRGEPAAASDEIAWTLVIPASDGFPPDVLDWSMTWDVAEADAAWAELRMTDNAGGADIDADIDMRATTTIPIALGTTTTYTIRALPSAPPIVAPSVADAGVGITVHALVYGSPERIVRALLSYARPGETNWASASFTHVAGDVWSASIPPWRVTTAGVMWRTIIEDVDTGVHRTHSRSDPGYISASGSASLVLRPTPGPDPIWNVVAPTLWPDIDSVGATLDGPSGGFLAGWFAWRWNADEQRWEVAEALGDGAPVATDRFSPGVPWFVAVVGDTNQTRQTVGGTVDATRAFALPLRAGWNLLANPFPFAVAWSDEGVAVEAGGSVLSLSDAVDAGITDGRLVYLDTDSQAYVTRDENELAPYAMPPGRGWWLHVDADLAALLISPSPATE